MSSFGNQEAVHNEHEPSGRGGAGEASRGAAETPADVNPICLIVAGV